MYPQHGDFGIDSTLMPDNYCEGHIWQMRNAYYTSQDPRASPDWEKTDYEAVDVKR